MRMGLAVGAMLLAPSVAMAEEPPGAPVKLVPLEEIGIVSAATGGVGVVAGTILLGVGLDAARWRNYPAGQIADEVVIAGIIMASGAVAMGVGIPLALVGKAQRERASALVVPTLGGAAVVGRF